MNELLQYEPVSEIVDNDAVEIGELYAKSNEQAIDALETRLECGRRLLKVKKRVGHGNFIKWIEKNQTVLGFSTDRTAQMLMKAAKANPKLASDLSESDLVKLNRQMWGHEPTNYRATGTGENEWYTPERFIDLANEVMGGIDLDPASNDEANKTVGAGAYYTAEDDGLSREWFGRVWLNPPYSRDLMPKFMAKLRRSVESGAVSQALVVTHNNTDTGWFHELSKVLTAACFPYGRIKFYRGEDVAAPVNGQMFLYFGENVSAFKAAFADIGVVMVPA